MLGHDGAIAAEQVNEHRVVGIDIADCLPLQDNFQRAVGAAQGVTQEQDAIAQFDIQPSLWRRGRSRHVRQQPNFANGQGWGQRLDAAVGLVGPIHSGQQGIRARLQGRGQGHGKDIAQQLTGAPEAGWVKNAAHGVIFALRHFEACCVEQLDEPGVVGVQFLLRLPVKTNLQRAAGAQLVVGIGAVTG